MARKNSSPMFRSTTSMPGAKGMMVKDMSTTTTITAGAMMNTALSAKGGIQSSLVKILIMSASTCRRPKGPTRFGPYRSCHSAEQPALEPDQHAADGQHHEEDAEEDDELSDGVAHGFSEPVLALSILLLNDRQVNTRSASSEPKIS